jgi:hypothetical protein
MLSFFSPQDLLALAIQVDQMEDAIRMESLLEGRQETAAYMLLKTKSFTQKQIESSIDQYLELQRYVVYDSE